MTLLVRRQTLRVLVIREAAKKEVRRDGIKNDKEDGVDDWLNAGGP